jgi:endonuclease/exonuclease/phosphatase (EEP) superfamily protein YafD
MYALAVLTVLGSIRWGGDGWWGVTVVLFTPRWLFLVPVFGLAAASGLMKCFGQWVLHGAIALVVAGPLMGFNLPVQRLLNPAAGGEHVRIATYNMGMDPIRAGAFAAWAERHQVDVICFQEGVRDDPRLVEFLARGWNVNRRRSIASRFPIVEELEPLPQLYESESRYSSDVERVRVRTPGGREVVVVSVHLPTLRPGFERLFQGDVKGLELHVDWWARELSRTLSLLAEQSDLPTLVGGDFNMPPDDSTMAALRTSFRFAFEESGWGYGYTRPARYPWVRIDHLMASPEWDVISCRIGPDFGSDHLPFLAEFTLPPAPERPTPRKNRVAGSDLSAPGAGRGP